MKEGHCMWWDISFWSSLIRLLTFYSGDSVLSVTVKHCTEYMLCCTWCELCTVEGSSSCSTCDSSGTVRVSSSERGLVGSVIAAEFQDESGCGTQRCPWVIEVPPGRVINLTLFDYGTSNDAVDRRPGLPASLAYTSSESQCTGLRYAVVKERANPREVLICGGGSNAPPTKHVYTSISNQLEISVIGREVLNGQAQFVVQYEGLTTVSL